MPTGHRRHATAAPQPSRIWSPDCSVLGRTPFSPSANQMKSTIEIAVANDNVPMPTGHRRHATAKRPGHRYRGVQSATAGAHPFTTKEENLKMTASNDAKRLHDTAANLLKLESNTIAAAAPKLAAVLMKDRLLATAIAVHYLGRIATTQPVLSKQSPEKAKAAPAKAHSRRRKGAHKRAHKSGMPSPAQRAGALRAEKQFTDKVFERRRRGGHGQLSDCMSCGLPPTPTFIRESASCNVASRMCATGSSALPSANTPLRPILL